MKKIGVVLCLTGIMAVFTACSSIQNIDKTTVVVDKNGGVTEVLVDTLDQDYYEAGGIQELADQKATEYNSKAGKDAVKVDSFKEEDKKIRLVMKYEAATDYKEFNGKEFFAGTISDAYDAGYTFTDMNGADGAEKLSADQVLEMGESHIVIWEATVPVRIPAKALYASANVKMADKKEAEPVAQEENGDSAEALFYVIY